MLHAEASVNLGRSRLELLKSTFNAENSLCRLSGVSQTISVQFTLKMCVVAQNCEKITKNPYFGGSKSLILNRDVSRKGV